MATSEYLDLGFPDAEDPLVKLQHGLQQLADATGYTPGPIDPLRVLMEWVADTAATNEQAAVTVARAVIRWIGENIDGVPFTDATPATASIVITAGATGGDIEEGVTEVQIDGVTFIAAQDVTIAATDSVAVTFDAETPGEDGNGLFAVPQPVTPLAWVTDWTLSTPTANGTEAETDDSYLAKVIRKRRTIGRPILPEDFEARGLDWPGVGRVLVLDGYNADTTATGQDATETLAVADPDGEPLSTPVMDALAASIAAEREVGWNSFVIAGTYTTIDVTATVSKYPGSDTTATETAAETALTDYLDPAVFGAPQTGEVPGWNLETSVRRDELVTVINNAEGVNHLESIKQGAVKAATAAASTDLVAVTGHGYVAGDDVVFSDLTGGAGLVAGTTYYVIASGLTADAFKVSGTLGGSAIDITSDMTAGKVRHLKDADVPLPGVAPLTRPGAISVTVV